MQNENINDLNTFENTFLIMKIMKTFDIFSTFSGLKPNKSKCEIAGLGAFKRLKLANCRMESIDLTFNANKSLGAYYSYDKNFKNQEKFINLVVKNWKVIPNSVILELYKIKKHFIWKNPNIKQDTLCKRLWKWWFKKR